jgi:AraC-like DNA-binding protein
MSADVLADLLARARARGAVFSHLTLARPWGVAFSGERPLTLHALLAGGAWLEGGGRPIALGAGDLVLAAAGDPYRIVHAPGAPAIPIAQARSRGAWPDARPTPDADPAAARLLCGAYTLEGTVCDGLLASLPRFAVLPAADQGPSLVAAVGLLSAEVGAAAPGQQTVLDHLLDLILVYLLRAWFALPGATAPGWYHALADPVLGPVLRAVHADPARRWTVASMAAVAGTSRAAFARRFAAMVGRPPATYLTELRMDLAEAALLEPGTTLADVAERIGYQTEFAFSDAFKRHRGTTPGRWRRARRDTAPDAPVTPTAERSSA